jgi:hypothetical protein
MSCVRGGLGRRWALCRLDPTSNFVIASWPPAGGRPALDETATVAAPHVMPAQAGIHDFAAHSGEKSWITACAGMT